MPPDYLVLGHVSKDVLDGGRVAAGGTITYSALTAQRLGLQAAVVTSCAPQDEHLLDVLRDEGVRVYCKPSAATTTFRNSYSAAGNRTQVLEAQAVSLLYEDVPEGWRGAPIVHLGPIAQELSGEVPSIFPDALLGITPQGWMRSWDSYGRVTHSSWPIPVALNSLPPSAILILSVEDVGHDMNLIERYAKLAPIVIVTQGAGDALVCTGGKKLANIPARPAQSVDPTGAGDVFATAFLVRYSETRDHIEATHFAHTVASCAVGGEGISAIPRRAVLDNL